MTGREHARLLGLLFWIYVGFQVLMMLFSLVFMTFFMGAFMTEISKMPRRANEPNPEAIFGMMGGIMVFAIVIGIIFLIPKVVAGFGLRNDKNWAKIWAIVGCCLAVLSFPLGTGLAIYGFWFIFGDVGKGYFNGQERGQHFPPPPPNNWQ